MNILKLVAQLALDGTKFRSGIREAQASVKSFSTDALGAIKGEIAAAFGGAALINFTKHSLKTVADMKDVADQFGVTKREAQELEAAADEIGLSLEMVGAAILKIGAARKAAAQGSEEERERFQKFGITLKELQDPALRNIDLFKMIGRAIEGMPRTAALEEDLKDFAGSRVGPRLTELLRELSQIKIVPVSDDAIDKIDRANKELEKTGKSARNIVAIGASSLMGSLREAWDTKNPLKLAFNSLFIKAASDVKAAFEPSAPAKPAAPDAANQPPLFEDKAAKQAAIQQREAEDKASRDLQEQLIRLQLAQVAPGQQRAAKGQQAREFMAEIDLMEMAGYGKDVIDTEKAKLARMAQELITRPSSLGVDSLTSSGQLGGGRNVVVSGEADKVVQAIKQFLGIPAKETASAVKSIDGKFKGTTRLVSSL